MKVCNAYDQGTEQWVIMASGIAHGHTAVSRKVVQQNRTRQYRKIFWVMGLHGP